jgi:hypothetical protein
MTAIVQKIPRPPLASRRPHVDAARVDGPDDAARADAPDDAGWPPSARPDTLALYFDARHRRARLAGDLLLIVVRALAAAAICSNLRGWFIRRVLPSSTHGAPAWHDDSSPLRSRSRA